MPVDQLTISGPALAALLQGVYTQQRPCDGLLLGSMCTTTSTQAHDSSDALVVEETNGHISTTYTCIGTHSFYSNSGQISGAAMQQLLRSATTSQQQQQQQGHQHQQQQQHQLLGWFSYRPCSPASPSMREVAVSTSLQAWVNTSSNDNSSSSSSRSQGIDREVAGMSIGAAAAATMRSSGNSRPVIFGLVTSQQDHNDATISLQYRFYYLGPPSSTASSSTTSRQSAGGSSSSNRASRQIHPYLQPIDLIVHNLGASHSSAAAAAATAANGAISSSGGNNGHMHIWGSSGLPTLSAVLSDGSSSGLSQQQQAGLAAAAAGASAAATAVQGVYEGLLDDLHLAAVKVSTTQERVEHLRAANVVLRQQVVDAAADATRRKEEGRSKDADAALPVALL